MPSVRREHVIFPPASCRRSRAMRSQIGAHNACLISMVFSEDNCSWCSSIFVPVILAYQLEIPSAHVRQIDTVCPSLPPNLGFRFLLRTYGPNTYDCHDKRKFFSDARATPPPIFGLMTNSSTVTFERYLVAMGSCRKAKSANQANATNLL
jgi:hypothetical protein